MQSAVLQARNAGVMRLKARKHPLLWFEDIYYDRITTVLISPYLLRSLTLANRITVAPMSLYNVENGLLTPWHRHHYSGAPPIVPEDTGVLREGRITPKCTGIWNYEQGNAYAELIRNMRTFGDSKISIQLSHAGRRSSLGPGYGGTGGPLTPAQGGWTTLGPSAVGFDGNSLVPKALDLEGMERIKQGFVEAAKRAMGAGWTGRSARWSTFHLSPRSPQTEAVDLWLTAAFSLEILAGARAVVL